MVNIAHNGYFNRVLIALVGGGLCALLSWFDLFEPLDWLAYDLANEASPTSQADDIIIVAIDERSLLEYGRWPWPREKHVALIRHLTEMGAAVIAVDIIFSEPDIENPEVDKLLSQAIDAHGAVVLPVFIGKTDTGELLEITPVKPMALAAAALGHVHIDVGNDGVAREVYLKEGLGRPDRPHFAVAMASLSGLQTNDLPGVRSPIATPVNTPNAILRDRQNLIPFMGPANTVTAISYLDVLTRKIPDALVRGKVVLVGVTAAGHVDNITTSLGQISGVEVNANIFHGLRQGTLAHALPPQYAALVSGLFVTLSILLLTLLKPRALLIAVFIVAGSLPAISWAGLRYYHLWLSPVPIIFSLLLSYPLWNWLRLDATVKFIRRQLQSLEDENYPLISRTEWGDLQRRAVFLASLGHLDQWELETIDDGRAAPPDQKLRWRHSALQSTKLFTLNGISKKLVLSWRDGHQQHSDKLPLFFPDTKLTPTASTRADMINMDLFVLEEAYGKARHHRDLINGSLEQLSSGVILAQLDGTVLFVNRQAQQLLSIPCDSDHILNLLAGIEFKGIPSIPALISALILDDETFDHEGRTIENGHHILCRGRLVKLNPPLMLFTLTDVSDLKKSEQQRTEALNFLSHDLRAPLTSVLALIEGAKHNDASHCDSKLLAEIEGYILRNLAYAEDYVQLSRLAHAEQIALGECDARSILDNAVRQIYHRAKQQGVTIAVEYCDENIPITGNPAWLERALVNLLDNALKHGPKDSIITAQLECDAQRSDFRIRDRGAGISDGDASTIFKRFAQGPTAKAGVGLGLHFVAAVAEAHQGEITVTNNLEGGACFTLSIPHSPTSC